MTGDRACRCAPAAGERVDRLDRRVHSVHCPPPEDRAAHRIRPSWPPRMGAWRWLHLPFAEPMAVLPGPAPGCADTAANDNAVVRIRASPTLGRFRKNRPDQTPHLLIERRWVREMPRRIASSEVRGYPSVCCGRSTHRWWHSPQVRPGPTPSAVLRRKRNCPSRSNPCPSRMLQSHFVGRAWFSAPMRPLGDLGSSAMPSTRSSA